MAEFCIGENEDVDLDLDATSITAVTLRAAIRFEASDQVRALALAISTGATRREVIILTAPRDRGERVRRSGLTALGPDREAIRMKNRGERLYDLGLGIGVVGFCVRTADPELARGLEDRIGEGWHALLAGLGGRILQASPTRVVRSPTWTPRHSRLSLRESGFNLRFYDLALRHCHFEFRDASARYFGERQPKFGQVFELSQLFQPNVRYLGALQVEKR